MKPSFPILLILIILIVTGIHIATLRSYPAPFLDEAWLASRAWAFIHTGRAFGPLDAGVFNRFTGYEYFYPVLTPLIQGAGLLFSPAPSLIAVRIVSLIWGCILLAAIYAIGLSLGGRRLGLSGALLTSLSLPFFYSAHLARDDIFAATFGFIAIALYLNHRGRRPWICWLSGFSVAVAYEAHPHSAIFGPALVSLFLIDYGWGVYHRRYFWAAMIGLLSGLALYASLHILPNPATFLALMKLAYGQTHLPPILTFDINIWKNSLIELGKMLIVVYWPMLPILLAAIFLLFRRRTREDRLLLVLTAFLLAGFTLYIRNKFLCYMILITPALDLMAASYLLHLLKSPWGSRQKYQIALALAAGCVAGAVILNLKNLQTDAWQQYQATQERVTQAIQQGESIMGQQLYWFGLYNHTYYSWENIIYFRRFAPGSTLADALAQFKPDILIVDPHLRQFISDSEIPSPYFQHLRLSKSEFDHYINQHAKRISTIGSNPSDLVEIYKISWQMQPVTQNPSEIIQSFPTYP